MAKIDITKTELVWPGKYNDDGTRKEVSCISLPFQVIETINQCWATREADKQRQQTLFESWEGKEGSTFDGGWTNKLPNRLPNRLAQVDRFICRRRRLGHILYLGCSTSICWGWSKTR